MIRLAVKRRRHYLPNRSDIDDESLEADLWAAVATSNYDPTQRQPHSHAYQVATRRLIDMARGHQRRLISAPQQDEDETRPEGGSVVPDGSGEELAERLRQLYVTTRGYFGHGLARRGPGRPTFDPAQKAAIVMLMAEKGWSCRDAERAFSSYPDLRAVVGVTQSRRYNFFSRARRTVTKLARSQKKLLRASAA